jgi:hypothetical protein
VPNRASSRPDLLVSVPERDAAERPALEALIARSRDAVAQALGVNPPAVLTLTFHENTSDFERVTARPWFTSGTVVNSQLHFLPIGVLRDRGILERTVRRALASVMTAAALAARPPWVREGVAGYFADPEGADVNARAVCPSDAELTQPISAGALSDALTRARNCAARQIVGGRSWREIR